MDFLIKVGIKNHARERAKGIRKAALDRNRSKSHESRRAKMELKYREIADYAAASNASIPELVEKFKVGKTTVRRALEAHGLL